MPEPTTATLTEGRLAGARCRRRCTRQGSFAAAGRSVHLAGRPTGSGRAEPPTLRGAGTRVKRVTRAILDPARIRLAVAPRQKLSYVDDAVSVGRRLRAAREQAGISQRALSFPGCTAAYISRIENGERIPSLQLLREFAARLGVSEQYLAYGRDELPVPRTTPTEARVAIRMGDFETARELATAA